MATDGYGHCEITDPLGMQGEEEKLGEKTLRPGCQKKEGGKRNSFLTYTYSERFLEPGNRGLGGILGLATNPPIVCIYI